LWLFGDIGKPCTRVSRAPQTLYGLRNSCPICRWAALLSRWYEELGWRSRDFGGSLVKVGIRSVAPFPCSLGGSVPLFPRAIGVVNRVCCIVPRASGVVPRFPWVVTCAIGAIPRSWLALSIGVVPRLCWVAPRVVGVVPRTSWALPRTTVVIHRVCRVVARAMGVVPRVCCVIPRAIWVALRFSSHVPCASGVVPRASGVIPRSYAGVPGCR
jgi:hypothetical protein